MDGGADVLPPFGAGEVAVGGEAGFGCEESEVQIPAVDCVGRTTC